MKDLALFYPENHEQHFSPDHPERPERVEAICAALKGAGLWESALQVGPAFVPEEVLYAIHSEAHTQNISAASKRGGHIDADTYVTAASWQLALNAAGGGIAVAEAVYQREAKRGLALSRPPGHHATQDHAMGFCLLNNIALTAEYLLQKTDVERIAILDIDLHHGNGTQDIFYNRGDVFFCSIHQYPLYPMTGQANETGRGEGARTTLNIPFPPYAGDRARITALDEVILPLFSQFQPDMVLVSAGFDAHWRDPLGHQLSTANGYADLITKVAAFADEHCEGRVAVLLEGGYDIVGGASSCLALTQAMIGQEWEDPVGPSPLPEDDHWITRLKQVKDVWSAELNSEGKKHD